MSWAQNLCKTYDACLDAIGICESNVGQNKMLLPIGHRLAELNVIIYLDSRGNFLRKEVIKTGKDEEKFLICIPCTDGSENRTGPKAIYSPNPLFDLIKYFLTDEYRINLFNWITYLQEKNEYSIAEQALTAIYSFILSDRLVVEFQDKQNQFAAFCVNIEGVYEERLWRIPELWKAWSDYYLYELLVKTKEKNYCYITGEKSEITDSHPKTINRIAANAKLISGNDKTNFTFRGRFKDSEQAITVGYESSQKMHQALRWLLASPNCYRCGTQTIIAWAVDKEPANIVNYYEDSIDIYEDIKKDKEILVDIKNALYVDYAVQMKKLLSGFGATKRIQKHKRRIAIIATDAVTNGRLSITYYRELNEEEYEEHIVHWHNTCKWYQPLKKSNNDKNKIGYFIGAPATTNVITAFIGKPRSVKDEGYKKIVKGVREQLLHCMFDGDKIPVSIVNSAYNRVNNPFSYENKSASNDYERWKSWEEMLCVTCALIRKYYIDYKKEVLDVNLEHDRNDRDYLYGRLLAIADRIESHARYKQSENSKDDRATNAMRYMTVFSQHPFRTWNILFTQQLNPYIQQLSGANWYLNLIEEIKIKFSPGEFENDTPLDGRYLLGFFTQRFELKQKLKNEKK